MRVLQTILVLSLLACALSLAFIFAVLVGWTNPAFSQDHASHAEMYGGFPGSKGHDAFHNWYSTLRRPDIGGSCCSGHDCAPTEARMVGDEIQVLLRGVWTKVDPSKIVKGAHPPDLGSHVCAPTSPDLYSPGYMFCVILGGGV